MSRRNKAYRHGAGNGRTNSRQYTIRDEMLIVCTIEDLTPAYCVCVLRPCFHHIRNKEAETPANSSIQQIRRTCVLRVESNPIN